MFVDLQGPWKKTGFSKNVLFLGILNIGVEAEELQTSAQASMKAQKPKGIITYEQSVRERRMSNSSLNEANLSSLKRNKNKKQLLLHYRLCCRCQLLHSGLHRKQQYNAMGLSEPKREIQRREFSEETTPLIYLIDYNARLSDDMRINSNIYIGYKQRESSQTFAFSTII